MTADTSPTRLTDDELLARIETLAARARVATADLIAHLVELEARGLHLKAGYESVYQYCRQVLGLAEYSAYNRIEAARAARKYPVILDMLRSGRIHLASVRILAPHLTPANHLAALDEACGKTKAQVEEIAVRYTPRPDAPPLVRRLPPPRVQVPLTAPPLPPASSPALPPSPALSPSPVRPPAPVVPLSPGRHRLQVTIDGETVEVLEMAQDLLRHAIPSGDMSQVVARALRCLLRELLKEKFAATPQPRTGGGVAPHSRHIPAEVKRTVYLRDRGRCAFVAASGRRCGARGFVEFHHVRPYMAGGEPTVENIQLRCRNHNQYEGRTYFARGLPASRPGASQPPTVGADARGS